VKIQDRAKAFLFSNLEQKPNKIPSDDLVDKKQTLNNTGQPEKTSKCSKYKAAAVAISIIYFYAPTCTI